MIGAPWVKQKGGNSMFSNLFGDFGKQVKRDISWSLMKAKLDVVDTKSKMENKSIAKSEARALKRMSNR